MWKSSCARLKYRHIPAYEDDLAHLLPCCRPNTMTRMASFLMILHARPSLSEDEHLHGGLQVLEHEAGRQVAFLV